MSVLCQVREPYEEVSLALSNVELVLSLMVLVIREHASGLPKGADAHLSFLVESAEKFAVHGQEKMDELWIAAGGRPLDVVPVTNKDAP